MKIELLAPARNLECGMAAIDHGADAVYIGAYGFGARQAAGNSTDDIGKLAAYAHMFGAKVYVTVNTIVYDHELKEVERLLTDLAEAGVDAVLVQDMAVADIMTRLKAKGMKMPEMHASTQTDNRCADKVRWLRDAGFSRVVLARELSLDEIKQIRKEVPGVELEVFVHGALCVSYSGACRASQHCFGRSANRGECAQFCRHAFDLVDSRGKVIARDSHLLSLKDMKQIDRLADIVDAGACSLKIEGRLKDIAYVKNVVAAYSRQLDMIVAANPSRYGRASWGRCDYAFEPNIEKTFNRGFTHYFLDGRTPDIASIHTPKAVGEYVGKVKEIRRDSLNVAGTATFANGDGLSFFTPDGKLEGFRVNRAENNRLFPLSMPRSLRPGMALYRNNDMEFERLMKGKTSVRTMGLTLTLTTEALENSVEDNNMATDGRPMATPDGREPNAEHTTTHDGTRHTHRLTLLAKDEGGRSACVSRLLSPDMAQKPQHDNMAALLSRLGGTPFRATSVNISPEAGQLFVPASVMAAMRRDAVAQLLASPWPETTQQDRDMPTPKDESRPKTTDPTLLDMGNVANRLALRFYEEHGVAHPPRAYETLHPREDETHHETSCDTAAGPLMTCRYCLKYSMGHCIKRGGKHPEWKEPLWLVSSDGRRMRLLFNCPKCRMEVYAE